MVPDAGTVQHGSNEPLEEKIIIRWALCEIKAQGLAKQGAVVGEKVARDLGGRWLVSGKGGRRGRGEGGRDGRRREGFTFGGHIVYTGTLRAEDVQ